jgi:Oxygenase domain of the 2OGFeDO superfamily
MIHVEADQREVDAEEYRGAFADERHVARMIDEPAMIYLGGSDFPSIVYVELDERLPDAVAALKRIRFSKTARTSGMLSTSRTFGYAPKLAIRGEETCRDAKLAQEDPAAHDAIASLAQLVERHYRELNPQAYAQHEATVEPVLAEWRLGGGLFTSGIINRNNKLPYHYDRGNFEECWSNMLVFKRHCAGGDLICPELNLGFRVRDHSLLMFDGQGILHGVSPFRLTRPDGHRFTVVYYSLKQMWRCETRAEGVALAAKRRTERERARFS